MGRRIQRSLASTSCPTLSSLYGVTNDISDGSILGNLAQNIPDAITKLRGKTQMKRTLKMTDDHMALIDEEIMASNVRKFGGALVLGHIFQNSTPINGM